MPPALSALSLSRAGLAPVHLHIRVRGSSSTNSSSSSSLLACAQAIARRHCSSSKGKGSDLGSSDGKPKSGPSVDNGKESTGIAAAAPPGFKGWKRFDAAADGKRRDEAAPPSATVPFGTATTTTASMAHDVLGQKKEDNEARRRAASARLADMFVESGRHVQWMQEQQQMPKQAREYREELSTARRVVPHAFDSQAERAVGDASASSTAMSRATAEKGSKLRSYAYDEDEDGVALSGAATSSVVAAEPVEVLEQELLDDNFFYYPPPAPLHPEDETDASTGQPLPDPARERYVPGQQIIPPGFTRYRVDVQYQGSDFDGWYKSVQRTRAAPPQGNARHSAAADVSDYAAGSRHFARTVLEEALAVALDVASVDVVAAAIPETGVSVRRLTCHVDVPSEVELQPRTILQRATLWLHQRQQPLALLSCHPCANQDFHARHSGVRRVYCYRILNRIAPPLFDAGLQWHVDRYLDVPRMQRMAKLMEGTHDYGFFADPKMANALRRAAAHSGGGGGQIVSSAYSPEHEPLTSLGLAPGEAAAAPKVAVERGLTQLERAAALPTFNEYGQRVVTYQAKPREFFKARTNLPTVRTIDKIDVVRQEDEVLLWFVGQSFLRHQIRNMVSVLKAGGHGLWDDQELQHAFQSGFEVSRKKFARERLPPAPVHGLTLWDVEYPAQHASDFVPFVDAGPYEPFDISTQV